MSVKGRCVRNINTPVVQGRKQQQILAGFLAHLRLHARWERAQRLGLGPPMAVKTILEGLPSDHPLQANIWSGRV
jgi:hypothetical protein